MNKEQSKYIILMYHKVDANYSKFIPALDVRVFARQINLLRRLYDIISLDDIFTERLKKGGRQKLIITFDDGYRCIYKFAYPILKKYSIPTTIFLSVGNIEGNDPIWSDLLHYYFSITDKIGLQLNMDNTTMNFDISTKDKRLTALNQIKNGLKNMPEYERISCLKIIKEELNVNNHNVENLEMLSWNEIKEMAENNIGFGAHTITHPILTKVPLQQAMNEIYDSKKIIENRIGRPVYAFAYPNGHPEDFNDEIKDLLRKTGYKSACTTIFGKNDVHTDPYELKRVYTSGNSILKFALRLWKAN